MISTITCKQKYLFLSLGITVFSDIDYYGAIAKLLYERNLIDVCGNVYIYCIEIIPANTVDKL